MPGAGARSWTVEDFLAFEAGEEEPCELVAGTVWMMTGRSAAHGAIKAADRVA